LVKRLEIIALILLPIVLFLGLNYRQLYAAWAIRSEVQRLANVAADAPLNSKNPALWKTILMGSYQQIFGNLLPSMALEGFPMKMHGMQLP
jgi:hypothetical protein